MRTRVRVVAAALGAALLLQGCVAHVQVAPRSFDWDWHRAQATWRAPGVAVVAELTSADAQRPFQGVVRTDDPASCVSFARPGSSGGAPLGEVVVEGTTLPIVAGEWYSVSAIGSDGPGMLRFSLRLDDTTDGLPEANASGTYAIQVRSASGEATCPFRFRIESARHEPAPAVAIPLAIVLVPVFLVLAVVAAPAFGGGGRWDNSEAGLQ